jgi:hypothetical protein
MRCLQRPFGRIVCTIFDSSKESERGVARATKRCQISGATVSRVAELAMPSIRLPRAVRHALDIALF